MLAVAEKLDRPWRARYYDPLTGAYLSQEPMGVIADENYYRYVHSRPTILVDASGLKEAGPAGSGQVGGAEGVQLLIDYYRDRAPTTTAANQNKDETAHADAVNDRENAGPQNKNEVQAAAEHYL